RVQAEGALGSQLPGSRRGRRAEGQPRFRPRRRRSDDGGIAMRELLAELTTALARRRPCVYCAVVETRGSTPQKAGAAMLVYPDGTQAGTLGGGCVEAEVKRRALLGLNDTGRPEVLTFCLDDDYGWGRRLGRRRAT